MFGIRRKLLGYMICELKGGQCHRVVNICRKRKIYIWHINFVGNNAVFSTLSADYGEVNDIAVQCGGSLLVKERRGLPYFIERNKKHFGFFVGLLLAVMCVYIMSLYIWNVEVTGNSYYTEETINQFLNDIGSGCGARKGKLVPSQIEEEMRIRYPFVSWVSVQIVGTKLLIAMEEGVLPKEDEKETGGDITAVSDGTVVSIMTRKGTALVHAGDEVKSGDVLIRGNVDIIGDDQSVTQTIDTGADGDIVLRINYPVSQTFLRDYKLKVYTGSTTKSVSIQVFNRIFDFGKDGDSFENSDVISTSRQFRLTENFYLPFLMTESIRQEYVWTNAVYDDAQIQAQMERYMAAVIENIERLNGKIIENHTVLDLNEKQGEIRGYLIAEIYNE